MTTSDRQRLSTPPAFAEGSNGYPRLSLVLHHATVAIFVAGMLVLGVTALLRQHISMQQVTILFYVIMALFMLLIPTYIGYLRTKPLPTREELIAKLSTEIDTLVDMLGSLSAGHAPTQTILRQLEAKSTLLRELGGQAPQIVQRRSPHALPALSAAARG